MRISNQSQIFRIVFGLNRLCVLTYQVKDLFKWRVETSEKLTQVGFLVCVPDSRYQTRQMDENNANTSSCRF